MRSKATIRKFLGKVVVVGGLALSMAAGVSAGTLHAEAATKTQLKQFRAELKTMLFSGDGTAHNVAKYNMTYQEANAVLNDLISSEGKYAWNTGRLYSSTTRNSNNILQTYKLERMDADFVNRYQRLCATIEKIYAGMDSKMTDLDKILYFHEYLVRNVYFKKDGDIPHVAGGPLGDGYGVCQGYSRAMILLLEDMGISCDIAISSDMNHAWVYLNLDGQWYHADVLWDDDNKSNTNYEHSFLLRNDKEFAMIDGYSHYNWFLYKAKTPSTSTKYSNWFVHNVKGLMHYYDGFWYYQDGNKVMRAKVDGSQMKQIASASGAVTVNAINEGILYYTADGVTHTIDLRTFSEVELAPINAPGNWNLDTIDWSDISYWKLGHYKPTNGAYGYYDGRICMTKPVAVPADSYTVSLKDSNYRVLVREFDQNGAMIQSLNLQNGATYTPSAGTVTAGISLYNTVNDKVTYQEYQALLADGLVTMKPVYAQQPQVTPTPAPQPTKEPVTEDTSSDNGTQNLLGNMDIAQWQDGYYDYIDASYRPYRGRICKKELVAVTGRRYQIKVSDASYHVLVRELDKDKKLLATDDLKSGDVLVPNGNTAYLAVNLYNETTRDITYAQYGELMKNGFWCSVEEIKTEKTEALGAMDIAEWQEGHYDYIDASLKPYRGRICKKDFVPVQGGARIQVASSKGEYHILLRELDQNRNLLATDDLKNGDAVTLRENTAYLAVNLYNENTRDITLEQYGTLFKEGLQVQITIE